MFCAISRTISHCKVNILLVLLALYNARLVARHGGIGAILHNVLDCHQLPRVNESLMATILSLLNNPKTRSLIKPDVDLEVF